MSDRVILGHVSGVHGIKGEVVVRSYTEDPAAIGAYGSLADANGRGALVVAHLRVTAKGTIVRFEGIADRTAAERLKGMALTIARSALPDAADGEFYHADLIGMAAVAPDGTAVGTVVAVQDFGAGTLLELRLAGGSRTEYVPFTDPHVPVVDVAARRLTVIMPTLVDGPDGPDGSAHDV